MQTEIKAEPYIILIMAMMVVVASVLWPIMTVVTSMALAIMMAATLMSVTVMSLVISVAMMPPIMTAERVMAAMASISSTREAKRYHCGEANKN